MTDTPSPWQNVWDDGPEGFSRDVPWKGADVAADETSASDRAAEPAEASRDDLSGLFEDDPAEAGEPSPEQDAAQPVAAPADGQDGLADIFAPSGEGDDSSSPSGSAETTDDHASDEETSSGPSDEPAQEHPDPAVDDLADLFADDPTEQDPDTAEQPSVEVADRAETSRPSADAAAASEVSLTDLFDADTDTDDATPPVARGSKIAEARRRATEASALDGDDVAVQARLADAALQHKLEERVRDAEKYYSYVDRILGLIGQTHELQMALKKMELTRDHTVDRQQRALFEQLIKDRLLEAEILIPSAEIAEIVFGWAYDELLGIGPLGELWRDDSVTEILVDRWNKVVVERRGRLEQTLVSFRSPEHAMNVARNMSQKISDRMVSPTNPLVTAELPGARVNFAVGAIVKGGLAISMRKFMPLLDMDALQGFGALNSEMHEFLKDAVASRATTLVSGGTGTGKTTMINALSEFIPANERVVTIEDAFELSLTNELVVSLQTKEAASADDTNHITQAMLLVNALRMRPDRIIVGEIRESTGATVMLQAANTGHDGTMTTIHANDIEMAVNRLAGLVRVGDIPDEVVKADVATAIDLIIQVTRGHGRRFISKIAAVDKSDIHGGHIEPTVMFVGDLVDGEPVFRRTGHLRDDTDLVTKMRDAGVDLERWTTPRTQTDDTPKTDATSDTPREDERP